MNRTAFVQQRVSLLPPKKLHFDDCPPDKKEFKWLYPILGSFAASELDGVDVFPIVTAIYVPRDYADDPDNQIKIDVILRPGSDDPLSENCVSLQLATIDMTCTDCGASQKVLEEQQAYTRLELFNPGYMRVKPSNLYVSIPRLYNFAYVEVLFVDQLWPSQKVTIGQCCINIERRSMRSTYPDDPTFSTMQKLTRVLDHKDRQLPREFLFDDCRSSSAMRVLSTIPDEKCLLEQ